MSAYPLAYMDVETCFSVRNRIAGRTDRAIAAISIPKIIFMCMLLQYIINSHYFPRYLLEWYNIFYNTSWERYINTTINRYSFKLSKYSYSSAKSRSQAVPDKPTVLCPKKETRETNDATNIGSWNVPAYEQTSLFEIKFNVPVSSGLEGLEHCEGILWGEIIVTFV
jgi:hypothetical protein